MKCLKHNECMNEINYIKNIKKENNKKKHTLFQEIVYFIRNLKITIIHLFL